MNYFVFTDAEHIAGEDNENIRKIYQENLGWPYNTLMRYHMFSNYVNDMSKFDYIFFFNANVRFLEPIGKEFLPEKNELLVVRHPGFWNKPNTEFTYERNPISAAYIPMGEGKYYVFGAVNGGSSKEFIKMILALKKNTDKDLKNNYIAVWHDESQLNKYILTHKYKILDPGYAYPEGWPLPFHPKIGILDKSKWADVNFLRGLK